MSNRNTILIILVLLLLAAGYALTQKPHHPQVQNTADSDEMSSMPQGKNRRTLDEEREWVKARIDRLEKMTEAQWDAELKSHPHRHGTLDESLKRAQKRLDELNAMNQGQWESVHNGGNTRQSKANASSLPNLMPSSESP